MHRLFLFVVLMTGAVALAGCGSDDDPVTPDTAPPDTTAPFAIVDLICTDISATSVTLSWTATGDDTSDGTADSYDVRYALSPINSANFNSATQATGEPAPKAAGQTESFDVTGLVSNTGYHFAIRAADEADNWSPVSNCPDTTTDVPDLYNATNNIAEDAGGVYSPDGTELAFWSGRIGAGHDIYVKDAKTVGGSATRVTTVSASGVYAQFPSWAPAGDKIVYQCNVDGSWDLWVADYPGGQTAKLTSEGGADEMYPEWSHDGTQIAFSSNFSGQWEVYTIPAGGGSWSQITSGGDESGSPTWSPDDQWIAYHHVPTGVTAYSIYKIRLSDSYVEQVTATGGSEQHPSWSPDGLYIAFDQNTTVASKMNISYCSASGGVWQLVSANDGIHDRYASWSPDGRRIAYSHFHSSQGDIVIKRVR
jgi:Tol biopolymer transport system component